MPSPQLPGEGAVSEARRPGRCATVFPVSVPAHASVRLRSVILSLLLISGVERNPGPVQFLRPRPRDRNGREIRYEFLDPVVHGSVELTPPEFAAPSPSPIPCRPPAPATRVPPPSGSLRRPPRVLSLNCRSLKHETVDLLGAICRKAPPDIICLQEVWNPRDELVTFLGTDLGYDVHLHRRERRPGGGVGVLLRRGAFEGYVVTKSSDGSSFEMVVVQATNTTTGSTFTVASTYWLPDGPCSGVHPFLDELETLGVDIIAGDFNATHDSWSSTLSDASASRGRALHSWAASKCWRFAHECLTSPISSMRDSDRCLDLFLFAPSILAVPVCAITEPVGDSDHLPLVLGVPPTSPRPFVRRTRPIRWDLVDHALVQRIRHRIASSSATLLAIDRAIRETVEWLPQGPLRPRLSPTIPLSFHASRKERAAAVHSPADAWRLLRSVSEAPPPCSPLRGTDPKDESASVVYRTPASRAWAFAQCFRTKHTSSIPCPESVDSPVPSDPVHVVTRWEVRSALNAMNRRGAADEHNVTARLLHLVEEELTPLLATAIHNFLLTGEGFPDHWKRTTFVPLLKTNKPPDRIDSYRPVGITPLLCRVVERVVYNRLYAAIGGKLSTHQYGFRPNMCTEDVLDQVVEHIQEGFRATARARRVGTHFEAQPVVVRPTPNDTLLAMIDLSDAFSRTPHHLIIERLQSLGAPPYLVLAVRKWLSGRSGRVFHEGARSEYVPLQAGVVQGSVLGPLLFLVFIDDLLVTLDSKAAEVANQRRDSPFRLLSVAYADDITIGITSATADKTSSIFAILSATLTGWCDQNGMTISHKTELMVFAQHRSTRLSTLYPPRSIGRIRISPSANPRRLLGWKLSSDLSFSHHAQAVGDRLLSDYKALCLVAPYIHPRFALELWRSAGSTALYGSSAWRSFVSAGVWRRLDKIFTRGLKKACGLPQSTFFFDAHRIAGMLPLSKLAEERSIIRRHRVFLTQPCNPQRTSTNIPEDTRPLVRPSCPPDASLDRVIVLPRPCVAITRATATEQQLREANMAQQTVMQSFIPADHAIFEAWTDGSVYIDPDTHVSCEGAAMVMWPPREEDGSVVPGMVSDSEIKEHSYIAPPSRATSFTAELAGPVDGMDHLVLAVTQFRDQHPSMSVSVKFCSDSQSWISALARGPLAKSLYAHPLWTSFAKLLNLVEFVVVGFMFSHCGDPHGDIVDAAAGVAASRNLRPSPPWMTDILGRAQRSFLRAARKELIDKQGAFIRESAVLVDFEPPARQLPAAVARDICRLRAGHWWRLGWGTVFHDFHTPSMCKFCQTPLSREGGPAVRHIFECDKWTDPNTATSARRIFIDQLFSPDVDTLRKVHEFCCTFITELTSDEQAAHDEALSVVPSQETRIRTPTPAPTMRWTFDPVTRELRAASEPVPRP